MELKVKQYEVKILLVKAIKVKLLLLSRFSCVQLSATP